LKDHAREGRGRGSNMSLQSDCNGSPAMLAGAHIRACAPTGMSCRPIAAAELRLEGIEGAFLIGVHLVLGPLLRPRRIKWGATDDETRQTLPGDALVPQPKWSYTQANTIGASATEIWPWLVQIGQGRGGFYSYEWLENLVGCDTPPAQRGSP
jgi:hypothetical protein